MERMEKTIMTTARRSILVCAFAIATALPCHPYDDKVTHPQLTVVATQKSALYQDGTIMFSLGLQPANRQRFLYRGRVLGSTGGTWSYDTASFVGEGAYDEDQGDNALNHFFDPVYNRGLSIPVVCGFIKTCNPSWLWMTEPADISGQSFSINDARDFVQRGLTFNDGAPADSSNQRGQALAALFLALGHLQHHMQDMTQPQHVRNDVHYDKFSIPGYSTPSRYEAYTANQSGAIAGYAAAGNPVFPSPAFKVPRDFWNNTANLGVAQFTNSSFVSYGTNFSFDNGVANANRTYTQPLPGAPHDYKVGEIFGTVPTGIQTICGLDGADCTMTMYPTAVEQKASTLSLFDQDLQPRGLKVLYATEFGTAGYFTEKLFALNRFNFDDAHPLLSNAAVSYSAGAINYFFRGKLQVLPPDSGPYAVVEPSSSQGFTTLKFKVKNNTAGEALSSGNVQIIAKFHRNGCYKPDLSGEFYVDSVGQLITPCPNFRSVEDYLRVAPSQALSLAVGETKDMSVTFSDPIPFDATDLILQVLYRGTVGDEAGGMALGAADLSETTYLSLLNATDVFELSGNGFFYYTDIIANIANPPYSIVDLNGNQVYDAGDVPVTGGPINYQFIINRKKVGDVTVPEGRFARIAMLVDRGGYLAEIIAIGAGSFADQLYGFPANNAQYDPNQNAYIVSPFGKLRADQSNHFDSVTYWHFYPNTGTPLNRMPISKAADATTPIATAITPP
jgi:hypothetical protein